jgi:hypothetical protein
LIQANWWQLHKFSQEPLERMQCNKVWHHIQEAVWNQMWDEKSVGTVHIVQRDRTYLFLFVVENQMLLISIVVRNIRSLWRNLSWSARQVPNPSESWSGLTLRKWSMFSKL